MSMLEPAALPDELATVAIETGPEIVASYAALTDDYNPIHLDPAFAAGTAFGRPIVHGTLGLNLVLEAIERTFGEVPATLSLDARFVRPVPVGTAIRAGGRLRDAAAGLYEVFVETSAGERAVEGTCTIMPGATPETKGTNAS